MGINFTNYLRYNIERLMIDTDVTIKGKIKKNILSRILVCTLPIFKLCDIFCHIGRICSSLLQNIKLKILASKVNGNSVHIHFQLIKKDFLDLFTFPKFIFDPSLLVPKTPPLVDSNSSNSNKLNDSHQPRLDEPKMTFDAGADLLNKKFGTEGKPLIKVNFKHFWRTFDIEEFLHSLRLTKDYQFIISDEPDYVFFSVFEPGKGRQIPDFKGNFQRIFFTGENTRPDMTKCEWAFSFDYDEELQHPKHFRLPLYKVSTNIGDIVRKTDGETIKKIKSKKVKFCNFLYSNQVEFRNRLFITLNNYKKIDAPGRCCNNMEPLGAKDPLTSRYKINWEKEKTEFLESYKFTIACENESHPGYTTEKIADPMLVDSVPIYWGNPLVHRDFNPKSFIHLSQEEYQLPEDEQIKKLVEKVIEVDQNDALYEAYLREPWFLNNQPSKYVNDQIISEKFKQIFKK